MILIVDDEIFAISLLQRKLAEYNLEIMSATTVQKAIEMIDSQLAFDLVITDLNMPNVSGRELLDWIHANKPTLKTIVTTAHNAKTQENEQFARVSCDKLILKPFSVEEELVPAIYELLQISTA